LPADGQTLRIALATLSLASFLTGQYMNERARRRAGQSLLPPTAGERSRALIEAARRAKSHARAQPPDAPAAPASCAKVSLRVATFQAAHPEKAASGGEDCVRTVPSLGIVVLADGVGGWAAEGIDPAGYARTLVRQASDGAAESTNIAGGARAPAQASLLVDALRGAHIATDVAGSATACLLRVSCDGSAACANVGDCGFLLLRDGRPVLASQQQQHKFNLPFQLGYPALVPGTDFAEDARLCEFQVLPGDTIVVASDGLWDNLEHGAIADIVAESGSPERAAEALVRTAAKLAGDASYDSPFSQAARAAGAVRTTPLQWLRGDKTVSGGKPDDTTVAIVRVERP
jgi:protein phosphatase PTC7